MEATGLVFEVNSDSRILTTAMVTDTWKCMKILELSIATTTTTDSDLPTADEVLCSAL